MGMTTTPERAGSGEMAETRISSSVFRAIANCTYDWESWLSSEGALLWVNAAVERMTGYRPEECLAMPGYPLPLVAASDRERIAEVMRDAKRGGSGNDLEFRTIHRDGSERWMAVSWQPMYDEVHAHLGFRASVRDITERHQLREQLRLHNEHLEQLVQERTARIAQLEEHRLKMEKLAALGQLAAGVAHEVNNPLAGIRNAFALFKANLSTDDEHYELLELIDGEIERISSITHQMYQLYRPSQQQASRFDLQRTVSDVLALLQPLAEKAGVTVQCRPEPCCDSAELGASEVVLREGEVKQILFNLVRNAIQASPADDSVIVRFATSDDQTTIAVIDRGEGVAEETVGKIFDPFFSTKACSPRQGMGLGLSVSRSLAEAMDGRIHVESELGQGSRFEVELPRRID